MKKCIFTDLKTNVMNTSKFLSFFVVILAIVSICISCNKHKDDITPYVNAYNKIDQNISTYQLSVNAIKPKSAFCIDSLQSLSAKMQTTAEWLTQTEKSVKSAIDKQEIQEAENIQLLNGMKDECMVNQTILQDTFGIRYNACFDYLIDTCQKLTDECAQIHDSINLLIPEIKASLNEVLEALNSRMSLTQMIEITQDLDAQVSSLENMQTQIDGNIGSLQLYSNLTKESLNSGLLSLSEDQLAEYTTSQSELTQAKQNNTTQKHHIEEEIKPKAIEIGNMISEIFDNKFSIISNMNSNTFAQLNDIEESINYGFAHLAEADEDYCQGISIQLETEQTNITTSLQHLEEIEGSVMAIHSGLFGSNVHQNFNTNTTSNQNNQSKHNALSALNSELADTLANYNNLLTLQDLLSDQLSGDVSNLNIDINNLTISSSQQWNNFLYNLEFLNQDNKVQFNTSTFNLSLEGSFITADQVNFLQTTFPSVDFNADLHQCHMNLDGFTLSTLDNFINFSENDYTLVAPPQNPNSNSCEGSLNLEGSDYQVMGIGGQLFAKLGKITVDNGNFKEYFFIDVKDVNSLDDSYPPTNLMVNFGDNINIDNVKLLNGHEQADIVTFARTLNSVSFDYQENLNKIELSLGVDFPGTADGKVALDRSGRISEGMVDALSAMKTIADNSGIEPHTIGFHEEGTHFLLNLNSVEQVKGMGYDYGGISDAVVYSDNPETATGLEVTDEMHNSIVLTKTTGGFNVNGCIVYKGHVDQFGAVAAISSDIEIGQMPGSIAYSLEGPFSSGLHNVAEICDEVEGVLYLNNEAKELFGFPVEYDIPIADLDFMLNYNFESLGGSVNSEKFNTEVLIEMNGE